MTQRVDVVRCAWCAVPGAGDALFWWRWPGDAVLPEAPG